MRRFSNWLTPTVYLHIHELPSSALLYPPLPSSIPMTFQLRHAITGFYPLGAHRLPATETSPAVPVTTVHLQWKNQKGKRKKKKEKRKENTPNHIYRTRQMPG